MATKVIKEIITDVGGNTTIEYSDDTTQKYNVADVVTAQSNPLTGRIRNINAGGLSIPVVGGAYNFHSGNMRKTRAKLAASIAGTGQFSFGSLGDSTQGGVGNTPARKSAVSALVVDELVRRGYSRAGVCIGMYKASADDERLSYSGAWNALNASSVMRIGQANGATATAAFDLAGTIARVWYSNAGQNMTAAIDGGGSFTITAAGGNTFGKYEVTGLSSANHSIVVTSTGNNSQLLAIEQLSSTASGIREVNFSIGGQKASELASTSWFANLAAIKYVGIDSCIVGIGYNDQASGYDPSSITNTLAIIDSLTSSGIEVIVQLINPSTARAAAVNSFYADIMPQLLSRDLPWVDSVDLFISQPYGLADGYYSDDVHLYKPGYLRQAQSIVGGILLGF